MESRTYIAIDLKSFYASVECVERGLDPLLTNLVVADASRTNKTICLAVSPALKGYGIPGRPRLFEVINKVKEINYKRKADNHYLPFKCESMNINELEKHPEYGLTYLIAPPRMAFYIEYSTKIYDIYLRYIAPEDIHVYSIDEVFMDVTAYLNTYKMSAHELAMKMIKDVLAETGITATAGIGTNMYLAKVAMDIVAKHAPADEDGVRIAQLNMYTYRKLLWNHTPITDFWRVGLGYANRLAAINITTMGEIARLSLTNEDVLYDIFGINAELLIDHAWGYENVEIRDIKAYKPMAKSLGSGQVLHEPYSFEKALIIVKEMSEQLSLDLVDKNLVTSQLVLTVGYDISNMSDELYEGSVVSDHYGRKMPKHAHGTTNLTYPSASGRLISDALVKLYKRITDPNLKIRRINLCAAKLSDPKTASNHLYHEQLDLFNNNTDNIKDKNEEAKDIKVQKAILDIKKKFGKNSILKGMNFEEGATMKDRNKQIGGHKA